MRRLALTGSLVLVSAALAFAQAGNSPSYSVGDTWIYSERGPQLGTEARVVKVEEGGRRVMARPKSNCPTCSWVYGQDLTLIEVLDGEGKPVDPSAFGFLGIGMKFFDFPLEVKKAWRTEGHGLMRGNNVPYMIECVVSSYTDVKTKAGTFKAFQIDRSWKVKVSTGPSPSWSDTVWWSPEVKNVVKFESGARNAQNFELISYTVKP
jgi:hypothetical protein